MFIHSNFFIFCFFNIFVQSTPGSFCHQAIDMMFQEIDINNPKSFCKTPSFAMQSAVEKDGLAFVALKNTIIPGSFVQATLDALKEYEITKIFSVTQMKIEMSLLRHEEALQTQIPLEQIASHPAALMQINIWKENHNISEIEIHGGTAEAARMLSLNELSLNTGVVGSKSLISLYPNLVVTEEGINDKEDNYTTFVLVKIKKRSCLVSEEKIKEELNNLVLNLE